MPSFDHDFWESLWTKTLRDHSDTVATRPPNAHLVTLAEELSPGRALDAGCGHGAETRWLAARGWQVTAVDFSVRALDTGREFARALGAEVANRIEWCAHDLASLRVEPGQFELVFSLYVHVAGSVEAMVRNLSQGVSHGGTILLIGHRPLDPTTGQPSPAAGQNQLSVEEALRALDPGEWEVLVAEERQRTIAGTGVDAIVRARRRE